LPVGNADNGVGLWAGQVMVSGNYNFQYIDWTHAPIGNEQFEHVGNLVTNIITPTITIGLTDYINLSYQQIFGIRSMDWMSEQESAHHRDEHSLKDFLNAKGSLIGDATFNLKYLLTNTGNTSGSRLFLGAGLVVPSNSVLTSNPFIQNDDGTYDEHRHFSLSDGCYKSNFELQFYIKNMTKKRYIPTFYGFTLNYIKPLNESKYGYEASTNIIGVSSILFATKLKKRWQPKGMSIGLAFIKTSDAYWDGEKAPNSKSQFLMPTIGFIFSEKNKGSLSVNFKYVQDKSLIPENAPDAKIESFEISVGYRKTLKYFIPWINP
jgi:hypothetical protein